MVGDRLWRLEQRCCRTSSCEWWRDGGRMGRECVGSQQGIRYRLDVSEVRNPTWCIVGSSVSRTDKYLGGCGYGCGVFPNTWDPRTSRRAEGTDKDGAEGAPPFAPPCLLHWWFRRGEGF